MIALHGFLGCGRDFDPFFNELKARDVGGDPYAPDLFTPDAKIIVGGGFREWAPKFLPTLDSHQRCLLGYSFGARLALHLALAAPERWDQVFLVSGSPGLLNSVEIAHRQASDLSWARRFSESPWAEVMAQWDAQEVFKTSHKPLRCEGDFSRATLATALTDFSLGRMFLSPEQLTRLPNVHWVCGAQDTKYVSLYKQLQAENLITRVHVVPVAGHRVIFDNPEGLADLVVAHAKL